MIWDKCKIAVLPEYHSMGRLVDSRDKRTIGRIIKEGHYLINDISIEDNYSIHFWATEKDCIFNSEFVLGQNLNSFIEKDKNINNFIIQRIFEKTNIYVNGNCKYTETNSKYGNSDIEIKFSQITSDKSPLRDFRFYDRALSIEEIEKLSKFIGYGYTPDVFKYISEFQQVYASNAANMFPAHF